MLAAIAGGVGAARFLDGLTRAVAARNVTAIVNTADDDVFHGLHVSPDLDSVTYMLAGASDRERGWGLADESFRCLEALERYDVPTWFRLGDRDIATHLYRTQRLRAGATLSEATSAITRAWGIESTVLPMTDDPVRTRITVQDPVMLELSMQEWFVRDQTVPSVSAVRFDGAERARPAPGVVDALTGSDAVLVCPSNPVISIGPILAVPGIRDALVARRKSVVAVSPIVGDRAVRGPADRLMRSLGLDATCVGVARMYVDICASMVIDAVDAHHAAAVEALGMRCVVTDTLMRSPEVAAALARDALDAVA